MGGPKAAAAPQATWAGANTGAMGCLGVVLALLLLVGMLLLSAGRCRHCRTGMV